MLPNTGEISSCSPFKNLWIDIAVEIKGSRGRMIELSLSKEVLCYGGSV